MMDVFLFEISELLARSATTRGFGLRRDATRMGTDD
jgi:hypothetical protein